MAVKCKYTETCGHEICMEDCCEEYVPAKMTNGDRIRAMTDEEMVNYLVRYDDSYGEYFALGEMWASREEARAKVLEWLRSEVGGDG